MRPFYIVNFALKRMPLVNCGGCDRGEEKLTTELARARDLDLIEDTCTFP